MGMVPVSSMMDRTTVNTATSQIGFLEFVLKPAYNAVAVILPKVEKNIQNIISNKERFSQLIGDYEQKMLIEKERIERQDSKV